MENRKALSRKTKPLWWGANRSPAYVLAKVEGGTNREAHAVAGSAQQVAVEEYVHELNVAAQMNVLGGIIVNAAADTIEVGGVSGREGFQYPGPNQRGQDELRCDRIVRFQVNLFVNGANRGVGKAR